MPPLEGIWTAGKESRKSRTWWMGNLKMMEWFARNRIRERQGKWDGTESLGAFFFVVKRNEKAWSCRSVKNNKHLKVSFSKAIFLYLCAATLALVIACWVPMFLRGDCSNCDALRGAAGWILLYKVVIELVLQMNSKAPKTRQERPAQNR